MVDLLVRYGHFLGVFILFATLFAEHLLLKPRVDKATLRKLVVIDGIYGASALLVLVMGLLLWLTVGKPSEFYSGNWILHLKVSLFVLVGLLSIVPTVFYIKHRNTGETHIDVPKKLIMIIRLELMLLVIIPLLAVLMAHGIGLS